MNTTITIPFIVLLTLFGWLMVLTIFVGWLLYILTKTKKHHPTKTALVADITMEDLGKTVAAIAKHQQRTLQHLGVVRFSPFKEVGGDQSYAVAILDGNGDGVILSNLHARNISRTYAKQIVGGKSLNHELSSEEEHALSQALTRKV